MPLGHRVTTMMQLQLVRGRDLNDGQKEKLDQTSANPVQINPDSQVPSFE